MSTRSKDRTALCTFTFADGRRCKSPRTPRNSQLCAFHNRKESQARAASQLADDATYLFSGYLVSASDLSAALGRVFIASAQGDIKPRAAATLAYLGQTLLQTVRLAQEEYIKAFGYDAWCRTLRTNIPQNTEHFNPPAARPSLPANSSATNTPANSSAPTSPIPVNSESSPSVPL
jgi:hypothetical protein